MSELPWNERQINWNNVVLTTKMSKIESEFNVRDRFHQNNWVSYIRITWIAKPHGEKYTFHQNRHISWIVDWIEEPNEKKVDCIWDVAPNCSISLHAFFAHSKPFYSPTYSFCQELFHLSRQKHWWPTSTWHSRNTTLIHTVCRCYSRNMKVYFIPNYW